MPRQERISSAERLAYWYLRLNGYLTIENFLVHPEWGTDIRTDADILGVRFPNRSENVHKPMIDDRKLVVVTNLIDVVIVEVKRREFELNGPWTNPENENIQRVLRSIGCVSGSEIFLASRDLYAYGRWSNGVSQVRLIAIGEGPGEPLQIRNVPQISWSEIIEFCIKRFTEYDDQKSSNGQWAEDGRMLRRLAISPSPARDKEAQIRRLFNLRDLID